MRPFTLDDFRQTLEYKPSLFVRFFHRVLFLFAHADPPGVDLEIERDKRQIIGIIDSMTPQKRTTPQMIDSERRQRIAIGSGTTERAVETLLSHLSRMVQVMQDVRITKSK